MPNPVLPFIPWTGGLNRRQNPTLAHPSQLVVAEDVVHGFDGARHKRGGQVHRNRTPIPGGPFDDHFGKSPPGDWTYTASDFLLTHTNSSSSWRGQRTGAGTTTITRTYTPRFPDKNYSVRFAVKTNSIVGTSSTYFEVMVNGGPAGSGDAPLARIRLRGDGIGIAVNTSTTDLLSTSIGTFDEMDLSGSLGTGLYDPNKYHVWRLDVTPDDRIKLYFDEQIFFTSNVSVIKASGTGVVTLSWAAGVAGDTIDVELDSLWITFSNPDESVVQALYDFPRPATKPFDRVDRMIAAVNGRVYQDPGDHVFRVPILENFAEGIASHLTFFSFQSFKGNLLIGRSNGLRMMRWSPGEAAAEILPGNPPPASLLRVHASRVFAAGDPFNPSRLYWSGLLNDELWTTTSGGGDFLDSGFVDIDPEDGGFITILSPPFHGELIVYKNTGIYRLQGDSFDNFAMTPITKAIGGIGHHTCQNVGNDQFFCSPFGVHSLLTTERFGDLEQEFLSNDIREFWNQEIRRDLLARSWAVNNEPLDRYELLCGIETDDLVSANHLNRVLCLQYSMVDELHPKGRWSMKKLRGGSAIQFQDEDSRPHFFIGGVDGFVNRQDEAFFHDFPVHRVSPGTEVTL